MDEKPRTSRPTSAVIYLLAVCMALLVSARGGSIHAATCPVDPDSDGYLTQDLDLFFCSTPLDNGVWLNQAGLQGGLAGQFVEGVGYVTPISRCSGVDMGDMDGDGDTDALVVHATGSGLYVNQGGAQAGTTGVFVVSSVAPINLQSDVKLGDFDGDGDLDVFLVQLIQQVLVLTNQGGLQGGIEGEFVVETYDYDGAGLSYRSVELADLDADGDLDAVTIATQAAGVWLNQGGVQGGTPGAFLEGAAIPVGGAPEGALGDLDGDLDPDLFAATDAAVWLNQGGVQGGTPGSFLDSGQTLGIDFAGDVELGDLDGDGDLDAFVTGRFDSMGDPVANRVWVNQGLAQSGTEGVFADSGQQLGTSASLTVALADVDGDCDLDAYIGNNDIDRLWLNQGGAQGGTEGVFADSGQTFDDHSFSFNREVALADVDLDSDNCPATTNPLQADLDTDGAGDVCDLDDDGDGSLDTVDCAPVDPQLYSEPGEVGTLLLTHAGGTTSLEWSEPIELGGGSVVYDTLAASSATGFATADCVESNDGTDTFAIDPGAPDPGAVRYFLVRAGNDCGDGTLGFDSSPAERVGATCP